MAGIEMKCTLQKNCHLFQGCLQNRGKIKKRIEMSLDSILLALQKYSLEATKVLRNKLQQNRYRYSQAKRLTLTVSLSTRVYIFKGQPQVAGGRGG